VSVSVSLPQWSVGARVQVRAGTSVRCRKPRWDLLVTQPGLTVKALRAGHQTTEEGATGTIVGYAADPLHPYLVELECPAHGSRFAADELEAARPT
jgi:hypothetical protein